MLDMLIILSFFLGDWGKQLFEVDGPHVWDTYERSTVEDPTSGINYF
jgi:hypothetical protein